MSWTTTFAIGVLAMTAVGTRGARAAGTPAAVAAALRGDLQWFTDAELAHDEATLMEMLNREDGDHGLNALGAAVTVDNEELAKRILALGGDAEAEDHDGHTPLHRAVVTGKLNMIRLLKEHGVDVKQVARDGFAPLHRASWGSSEARAEIVRFLIRECEEDVDRLDVHGLTAAFRAVDHGNVFMLKVLIELGADVNFLNKRGDSMLATAVRKQNVEIVQALLDANADVTKEDSKGRNLRKLAKQLRSKKVLDLISQAYASATSSGAEL